MFFTAILTTKADILSNPPLQDLGITVIAMILVLKLVLDFFRKRKFYGQEEPFICSEKDFEKCKLLLETLKSDINKLMELHNKFDADGIPLWYTPRSWSETQIEIIQTCQTISANQRSILRTIERIEQRLDKR